MGQSNSAEMERADEPLTERQPRGFGDDFHNATAAGRGVGAVASSQPFGVPGGGVGEARAAVGSGDRQRVGRGSGVGASASSGHYMAAFGGPSMQGSNSKGSYRGRGSGMRRPEYRRGGNGGNMGGFREPTNDPPNRGNYNRNVFNEGRAYGSVMRGPIQQQTYANRGGSRGRGNNGGNRNGDEATENDDWKMYGIGYRVVEEYCDKLDRNELLIGSSDLIRMAMTPKVFNRMNQLWKDVRKDGNFLRLVVVAGSSSQMDVRLLTHDFVSKVMDTQLVPAIMKEHIFVMQYDSSKCGINACVLLENLALLLMLFIEREPTASEKFMSEIIAFNAVLGSAAVQSSPCFTPAVQTAFQKLTVVLEARNAEKAKRVKDPPKPKRVDDDLGPPPENFRDLKVEPSAEDMLIKGRPYLRKNLKKGRYQDGEHYLDVQFRLLREDMLQPLRDGIDQYSTTEGGGRRRLDFFVYKKVRIDFPHLDKITGEMVCNVAFERRRCRWMKQLIYGSLLCFSTDEFRENFLFGTVFERSIPKLDEGFLTVLFTTLEAIDHVREYKMIESSAYYEAYHPVLRGLQAFQLEEPLPFHRYLVDAETATRVPAYIERALYTLNFGVIIQGAHSPDFSRSVDTRYAHERLSPSEVNLDVSQHKALTMSFAQDLVVIQGPPGTGKTHLGLMIARVLLANEDIWNPHGQSPMLVVCYTNHALDQFLMGIIRFMRENRLRRGHLSGLNTDSVDVIRVGSRSKCEEMKKYSLNEIRKDQKVRISPDLRHELFSARSLQASVMNRLTYLSSTSNSMREKIVSVNQLWNLSKVDETPIVSSRHREQFMKFVLTLGMKLDEVFADWLLNEGVMRFEEENERGNGDVEMNFELISQLMEAGFQEIFAKNLSILGRNDFDGAMNWIERQRENIDRRFTRTLLPQAERWPTMADMRVVMEACDAIDEDAFEALTTNNYNTREAIRVLNEAKRRAEVAEAAQRGDRGNDDDEEMRLVDEYDREMQQKANDFDDFISDDSEDVRSVNIVKLDYEPDFTDMKKKKKLDKLTPQILNTQPCTAEEAATVDDVVRLARQNRWALYKFWVESFLAVTAEQVKIEERKYSSLTFRIKELYQLANTEVLRSAKVIGMTTTGAARLQAVLRSIQCPVVVIEEAAEVLEAHIVTSLTVKCQHAILIGDHKQLRPNPAVYELAKKFDMDVSLFERLINNGFPYATLVKQHRMRREIARTLMPHFYPELEDDPSVYEYPDVMGVTKNLMFINHNNPEDPSIDESRSHKNTFEVRYAVYLAQYFLQQCYEPNQVTILCTYLEQMITLRRLANEVLGKDHSVRIEVVDNYQGEESDIIILSLVRSANPQNTIGFLKVPNRVCVALSRAKIGLYCIANVDFLASMCDLWKNIQTSLISANAIDSELEVRCRNHGNVQKIGTWKDFTILTPEGGCREPCDCRLDCGHVCKKRCHATSHDLVRCMEACARKCAARLHECKALCYVQPCPDCKVKVTKVLPCGHSSTVPCWQPVDLVKCTHPCEMILPCGHPCANKCSDDCTTSCKREVQRMLTCGHLCKMACHERTADKQCGTMVTKCWPVCGHEISVKCFVDPSATPCPHPCQVPLPDCEHPCTGTCGECRRGRLHVRCKERCKRVLICGHVCDSECSKVCPPCTKPCETECAHSRCGYGAGTAKKIRNQPAKGKGPKGRLCGQLCPLCVELCANGCEHRQCPLNCHMPCTVDPCNEPCSRKLKCDHACLGICGEACPDLCKDCKPEEFAEATEIFFGTEDDDGARFLQLDGCNHIVEVTGMDHWVASMFGVNTESSGGSGRPHTAITQLVCPRCKTAVKRCKRYQKFLNQRAQQIERVKEKMIGKSREELESERKQVLTAVNAMLVAEERPTEYHFTDVLRQISALNPFSSSNRSSADPLGESLASIMRQMMVDIKKVNEKDLTNVMVTTWNNITTLVSELLSIGRKLSSSELQVSDYTLRRLSEEFIRLFDGKGTSIFLHEEAMSLCSFLEKNWKSASTLMLDQFTCEIVRLRKFMSLSKIAFSLRGSIAFSLRGSCALDWKTSATLASLYLLLNGTRNIDDELEGRIDEMIKEVAAGGNVPGLGITEKERIDIKRAMGGNVTNWYCCSKGHVYGIGECGQPMQMSKCPECGEQIGGQSHRLVDSSQRTNLMGATG